MGVLRICLTYKKEFSIQPHRLKMEGRGQYCSRKCRYTGLHLICKCGNTFYINKYALEAYKKHYCSKKCADLDWKGKRRNPKTEFKKGFLPWNKGLKGIMPGDWEIRCKTPHFTGEKSSHWKGGMPKCLDKSSTIITPPPPSTILPFCQFLHS